MRKALAVVAVLPVFLLSCTTAPVTGRRQLALIPTSTLHEMSFQTYQEFLAEHPPSASREQTAMVGRVGQRIQQAVERYFARHDMSDRLKDYEWEFTLIESPEVNAWCMPGGKVVVYTGILPLARDEVGLAVVMGHEVAHAVAGHGNERMSQQLVVQLGGMALERAVKEKPQQTKDLFLGAYGAGAHVGVLLPYSRTHELEADHLGLLFMAMAGYDPREAVAFWERMAAYKKGGAPPEFLSTHPSDRSRILKIQELIPEAMGFYTPQ